MKKAGRRQSLPDRTDAMDNSYGLLHVQEANLRILREIHRISEKFRIPYALDSGTLLGAIRHGGFIPWDDDADIVMTRNSFEAFRKVAKRELPEDMHLLLPDSFAKGSRFYDFVPRVILDSSRRHLPDDESTFYEEKLNHLWVDIFILDRMPDNDAEARLLFLRQKAVYLFSMGHRQKLSMERYPKHLRLPIAGGSRAGKLLPMKGLFREQQKLSAAYGGRKTERWYYSNYDPQYWHIRLLDSWVKEHIKIRFEDTILEIPKHYDEILKLVYGNYMELPPKEDRIPSHGSREIEIYG